MLSLCEPPRCALAACEVWLGGQRPFYVDVLSDCRSHASEAYIVGFRKLLDLLSSDPRFSEAWKKAPRLPQRGKHPSTAAVDTVAVDSKPIHFESDTSGTPTAWFFAPRSLPEVKELHLWSDCGPHFRSCLSVGFALTELTFGIRVVVNFFVELHGKSDMDRHFQKVDW